MDLDHELQIWCQKVQEKYQLAYDVSRYFVSAKSDEGVSDAFQQMGYLTVNNEKRAQTVKQL